MSNFNSLVSYEALQLAARAAKLLTDNAEDLLIKREKYDDAFYVGGVELKYYTPGMDKAEDIGVLRPDEFDGGTWELWVR